MDSSGKVSVVIPVYNSENFLRESIESVLNQTYSDIEVIAVDDGSTDKSLDILKEFSDKILVISQLNQGLGAALQTGTKNISGKWLKWFSPDDILYPNAIESLVSEAKNLPPNTIVYSNWEIIDENDKKLGDFTESNYNELSNFEYNIRLLDGQQINVNTTLIPESILESGCHFQNLENPIAIDYDFFLRAGILFNTKFFLVEKQLLKYRIHKNQLSHKNIYGGLSFLNVVRNNILEKLDNSEKIRYMKSWHEYEKKKSFTKKTLETGLHLIGKSMPNWLSDKMIVFYLNRIRRTR